MKLDEVLLNEQPVFSSWIEDLAYKQGGVVMTLGSGRVYFVARVKPALFKSWIAAASKGRFWHRQIKERHITTRIE